mmetsp:Transcript_52884/g.60038  ORF Transcript_52884/g.60038 Transcript_52884/m.60038 type:complete len:93 (-) Transcript_52884:1273-1551(-)
MDQPGTNDRRDRDLGKSKTTEDQYFQHVMETNQYRRQPDQRMDDAEMVLDSRLGKFLNLGFSFIIDQYGVPQSRSIMSHLRCGGYHRGRGGW